MSFADLLAAKRAADAALAAEETQLLAELLAAKDAHRQNRSQRNRERKAAAVAAIRAVRAESRRGRTGLVGGDAFLSPVQNEG